MVFLVSWVSWDQWSLDIQRSESLWGEAVNDLHRVADRNEVLSREAAIGR